MLNENGIDDLDTFPSGGGYDDGVPTLSSSTYRPPPTSDEIEACQQEALDEARRQAQDQLAWKREQEKLIREGADPPNSTRTTSRRRA